MGLSNEFVAEHMDALFGKERANSLRGKIEGLRPEYRESCIVEELCEALGAKSNRYVLPFGFKNDKGTRTNHHLIFVTKHVLGYTIMKEIMAEKSSKHEQGVASFYYSPADKQFPLLFEWGRPLDDLQGLLLAAFSGKTLRMKTIFQQHHVGRPFIEKNYKSVL